MSLIIAFGDKNLSEPTVALIPVRKQLTVQEMEATIYYLNVKN